MKTIIENPMNVRAGQSIATGANKSRKIKKVSPCESKPECVHLDHECFDARFSTVELVIQ